MNTYDISVVDCELYFCPIETRTPLKFGIETTTHVVSARTKMSVKTTNGAIKEGWGETPLSVAWVWPGTLSYSYRLEQLQHFCTLLRDEWKTCSYTGHSVEIGHLFTQHILKKVHNSYNSKVSESHQMPYLAALVCNSLFDIALFDAYGNAHNISVWDVLNKQYMNHDLSWYYGDEYDSLFKHRYPQEFLVQQESIPTSLVAWHLVGAKDILTKEGYEGEIVEDGYPFFLTDWIKRDGLTALKVKLSGTNSDWDYKRLVDVGTIAIDSGVLWLTADFNCTVLDPLYVCNILDTLLIEHPRMYGMLLYVEQPFPYEIMENPIDVHSVSARKPLFMDESAHDWQHVAFGRNLGWTGVALKTCKTFSGALLSLCFAKAHGMTLMVQDLTNPMLAQIPHVALAAHSGTIMGVETNAMQFYPEVSSNEMKIHPGLYRRNNGRVDLSTLSNVGFGYRNDEIVQKMNEDGVKSTWVKVK